MFVILRQTFKRPVALLLAVLFCLLSGCAEEKPVIQVYQGMTMGTTFTVKWMAVTQDASLTAEVESELKAVNQSMSTYIADSELSLLNRSDVGVEQQVSADLRKVLQLSQHISTQSEGAFDVTVGPLVNLWGFGPDGRVIKAPQDDQITAVLDQIGYEKFSLADASLVRHADLYIDLSAIAKGHGVDRIAELLEEKGINSYLVEIGGELRAKGVKPDGSPWRIAIESPVAGFERSIQQVIEVKDVGVATSGDYRNYFEENGIRFSHTIDPKTGRPITHKLASVTVIAKTCAEADGYATAMMVLGPEKAIEFAEKEKIEAFLIVKSPEGFTEVSTSGFEKYLMQ